MAHMLEMIDGKAQMAYAGDTPWHRLGTKVPDDLTPEQIMSAAGLDWTVEKHPGFFVVGDEVRDLGRQALVRSSDGKMLDVVSDDWNPVQNREAFEFFDEFVRVGDMSMDTAGSLRDGQIVWGLAKVKSSFELFKGDRIDSYLLFSNFHKYGHSTDVRFTPIRVVCNNTLTLSLNSKVEKMVKISHRKQFNPDDVKTMLGIATDKLDKYKEMAEFLGSKMARGENIVEYFKRVFPSSSKDPNEVSKNAKTAMSVIESQPGAEYAPGTWWQMFNASTYTVDHLLGKSDDRRLTSAWYGNGKVTKDRALELAIEYADA